jgi:hypothetical protein
MRAHQEVTNNACEIESGTCICKRWNLPAVKSRWMISSVGAELKAETVMTVITDVP